MPDSPNPAQMQSGKVYVFRMSYRDLDGDRPTSATLVAQGPAGTSRINANLPRSGQFRTGVPLEWSVGPLEPGEYQVYYETSSVDGRARYPADARYSVPIPVVSAVQNWVLLAVGLGVALLFIPMAVFFVLRAMGRRLDPGHVARFALLVGILAGTSWYVYLFQKLHSTTTLAAVAGVMVLGAVFVFASLKRSPSH